MSMNYKKMWEQLKASGNEEILKRMQSIEKEINKPKEIKKEESPVIVTKTEINIYEYQTIEQLKNELNKYSIEEIKQIIKKNYYKLSEFKGNKDQIIESFSRKVYNFTHRGDCFRNCTEATNKNNK